MPPTRPITIDTTPALRQTAGIGRYTRELVRALVYRGRYEYVLFVADRAAPQAVRSRIGAADMDRPTPTIRTTRLPARLHAILWHRLRLPIPAELWTGRMNLYHATDFLAPPLMSTPAVITVHDLSFLRHPERAEPALQRHLARSVPRAVVRAAHVIADSHYTKGELGALLGTPEAKITVAYPGVGPAFRCVREGEVLDRVRREHGLTRPFILGVGTLEPRKDWPVLIEAFARLGEAAPGHELVIAGAPGWLTDAVSGAVARSTAHVRLLGFVPDGDLPALYSLADAFAYPSIYEGFGLPPLEALACGTPTVVTAATSLPEVVGDAALTVPPGDPGALAGALADLLTHQALRDLLAARGPQQASRFTWDACAEAVERAYEKVLGGLGV